MPSDRHGQESLNRRLKADLTTFKGLVESGVLGGRPIPSGASAKHRSLLSGMTGRDPASPASVAARIRNRQAGPPPAPGAGWDTGVARMGGRTGATDMWGTGMINEEERGS
jgi:hypothetical protein